LREIELNDEKKNLNDRKHGDKNKGNTNFRLLLEEQDNQPIMTKNQLEKQT
jgi:hypothetical protein